MLVLGSITVSEIQHGPALPPVVLPSPSASPAPSVAPEVQPGPVHEVTGFLSLIASPQDDGRPRVLTSLTQRVEGRLSCQGSVEYGDVTAGAPVTVFDSHGAAVASGVLGQGRAADETVSADDNIACLFPFTVSRVPADRGPYQIDIAQRGAVPVEGAAEGGVLRVFVSLGD